MIALYSKRSGLFPATEVEKTPFPHRTGVGSGLSALFDVPSWRRRERAISELQCCRRRAIDTVHPSSPVDVLPSVPQRIRSTCWGLSFVSVLGSQASDDGDGDVVSTDACLSLASSDIADVWTCLHAQQWLITFVTSMCQVGQTLLFIFAAVMMVRDDGLLLSFGCFSADALALAAAPLLLVAIDAAGA